MSFLKQYFREAQNFRGTKHDELINYESSKLSALHLQPSSFLISNVPTKDSYHIRAVKDLSLVQCTNNSIR